MTSKSYLVTGGSGFIGAALTRRLVLDGFRVRVFDNNSRGAMRRLAGIQNDIEFVRGDIRNPVAISEACRGMDGVCHLAYINGTESFYTNPELVLEVGVKGISNVIDGCLEHGVTEFILASSSEVYQEPSLIPTPETVPLVIPDPLNPRYSYSGGKILSELMALNFGRRQISDVKIFRPHNVYGPDMGWEHVLPQFVLRMKNLNQGTESGVINFPIQGNGVETRAFTFIGDLVDGVRLVMEKGVHLGIYHIGMPEEISIVEVARLVGKYFEREVNIIEGKLQHGGALRRCPDISKLIKLGYKPKVVLEKGLPLLAEWYLANEYLQPVKSLKEPGGET